MGQKRNVWEWVDCGVALCSLVTQALNHSGTRSSQQAALYSD